MKNMKNKVLSRSDVVEVMAKYSGPNVMPCRWWRSFFKKFGWDWRRI